MNIEKSIEASFFSRATRAAFALVAGIAAVALLASCGNRLDTEPLVASAIVITSPSGTTSVEGSIQFSANVTDVNGHAIAVAPSWSVVNGGGTITSSGLFTAGDSAGTYVNTVVATIGSVRSSSTVTVSPGALSSISIAPDTVSVAVGATQQFVAVGRDAHGNVAAIPDRIWSVSNGGSIDTSGVFTAGPTVGDFSGTIHVMSGSICADASVVIIAGPLARIAISPAITEVGIDRAPEQFTVIGYDAAGNVAPITGTVVWSITFPRPLGTIDSTGLFTMTENEAGYFRNAITVSNGTFVAHASFTRLGGN